MKFGYEFRRTTIQLIQDNTSAEGLVSRTSRPSSKAYPTAASRCKGNSRRHSFENSHGFYIQDSFRWTRA